MAKYRSTPVPWYYVPHRSLLVVMVAAMAPAIVLGQFFTTPIANDGFSVCVQGGKRVDTATTWGDSRFPGGGWGRTLSLCDCLPKNTLVQNQDAYLVDGTTDRYLSPDSFEFFVGDDTSTPYSFTASSVGNDPDAQFVIEIKDDPAYNIGTTVASGTSNPGETPYTFTFTPPATPNQSYFVFFTYVDDSAFGDFRISWTTLTSVCQPTVS